MSEKIKQVHDLLDEADVFASDGTHPQLIDRVGMLVSRRNELQSENERLRNRTEELGNLLHEIGEKIVVWQESES